ncbi:S49 family peptidase [Aliarcobacter butzleri]|uniref:S49 family peptidase n=2 Tax=Aliarcobacter butzleri TaxID=28197 RepID=UPI00263DF24A|nr:S49 family peptidase [Aliarcobacter butzleri]MDN5061363.1 S49 family peptidase [Aliarcobacter butzleri]
MHKRILGELISTPWLIMPSWLEAITNLATGQDILANINHQFTIDQITDRQNALSNQTGIARQNERLTEQRGDVGILNLHGPIIRFGGMMEISGHTSTQTAMREFNRLENDPSIKTIVIHSNGPGGQSSSIDQFANMVAKSNKRTIGFIDSLTASAHYWIVSACDEIVASSVSMIGCLGVVYSLVDDSKKKENEGVTNVHIVSDVSPKKVPDIRTVEGQEQIQKWANSMGEKFIQAVAINRKVSVETVKDKFGQGDLLISDEALKVGMIDKIQDFEDLMSDLKVGISPRENQVNEKQGEKMTAEEIQGQYPEAYNAIFSAGATAERVRIQDIEASIPKGFENVETLSTLKFDGVSNSKDVKVALFDYEQAQKAKISQNIRTDAQDLNTQSQEINDLKSESNSNTEEKVTVSMDAAIAKINEGRK